MRSFDVAKVKEAVLKHGDDFWRESTNDPEFPGTNADLFEDILNALHEEGLDLQLIPLMVEYPSMS